MIVFALAADPGSLIPEAGSASSTYRWTTIANQRRRRFPFEFRDRRRASQFSAQETPHLRMTGSATSRSVRWSFRRRGLHPGVKGSRLAVASMRENTSRLRCPREAPQSRRGSPLVHPSTDAARRLRWINIGKAARDRSLGREITSSLLSLLSVVVTSGHTRTKKICCRNYSYSLLISAVARYSYSTFSNHLVVSVNDGRMKKKKIR